MSKIHRYVDAQRRLVAVYIPAEYSAAGVEFVTDPSNSMQLAVMTRPEGEDIESHFHNQSGRIIKDTQEALFLRKGSLAVFLYDQTRVHLATIMMKPGDVILLVSGGHGFKVLEEVDLVEIKQGPYIGPFDKTVFVENTILTTTTPVPTDSTKQSKEEQDDDTRLTDSELTGTTSTPSAPEA